MCGEDLWIHMVEEEKELGFSYTSKLAWAKAIPNVYLEWFMPFQTFVWNGIALSRCFMV